MIDFAYAAVVRSGTVEVALGLVNGFGEMKRGLGTFNQVAYRLMSHVLICNNSLVISFN